MSANEKEVTYSQGFRDRVRAEYGHSSEMMRLLDENNPFLGRYLDDSSSGGIDPDDVVLLLSRGKSEELRKRAEQKMRRRELYGEWAREMGFQW